MTSRSVEQHYRFCPRCGIENPRIGNIPFRCPECQFAQFFGPVAAVGALVINEQDQLLLVRRAHDPGKGKWGMPGGFVDRDETMEQALSRETMEETQLRIIDHQYLTAHPNHYDYLGIVIPVIDLFFLCRVQPGDPVVLADSELTDYQWARPTDSHLDNMAFYSNRLAIEKWLAATRSSL